MQQGALEPATHIACASTDGHFLTFAVGELKELPKGGRGLMLMRLEEGAQLAGAAPYTRSICVQGLGRGGKERSETFEIRSLNNALAARGRKGKAVSWGFKVQQIHRVE